MTYKEGDVYPLQLRDAEVELLQANIFLTLQRKLHFWGIYHQSLVNVVILHLQGIPNCMQGGFLKKKQMHFCLHMIG